MADWAGRGGQATVWQYAVARSGRGGRSMPRRVGCSMPWRGVGEAAAVCRGAEWAWRRGRGGAAAVCRGRTGRGAEWAWRRGRGGAVAQSGRGAEGGTGRPQYALGGRRVGVARRVGRGGRSMPWADWAWRGGAEGARSAWSAEGRGERSTLRNVEGATRRVFGERARGESVEGKRGCVVRGARRSGRGGRGSLSVQWRRVGGARCGRGMEGRPWQRVAAAICHGAKGGDGRRAESGRGAAARPLHAVARSGRGAVQTRSGMGGAWREGQRGRGAKGAGRRGRWHNSNGTLPSR